MSAPQVADDEMHASWWEQRAEAFAAWAQDTDPAGLRPLDTRALQQIAKLAELREDDGARSLSATQA